MVEDSYKDVLNIKMLEGRWFSKTGCGTQKKTCSHKCRA